MFSASKTGTFDNGIIRSSTIGLGQSTLYSLNEGTVDQHLAVNPLGDLYEAKGLIKTDINDPSNPAKYKYLVRRHSTAGSVLDERVLNDNFNEITDIKAGAFGSIYIIDSMYRVYKYLPK